MWELLVNIFAGALMMLVVVGAFGILYAYFTKGKW